MKLIKIFALTILLTGLWLNGFKSANAAPTCAELDACYGRAQDAYESCIPNCSGIIACEAACGSNLSRDQTDCDQTYSCP